MDRRSGTLFKWMADFVIVCIIRQYIMIMLDKTHRERGREVRSRADCPSIHLSSYAYVICPHRVPLRLLLPPDTSALSGTALAPILPTTPAPWPRDCLLTTERKFILKVRTVG